MFFKYSLPFQKVLIHPEGSNPAQPKISLIFLKSQHSFRHLSIRGHGIDADDALQLKILPKQILTNLIERQKNCPLPNKPKAYQVDNELVIDHYECSHKPLPEYSNIQTLSLVHHALGFLPEPGQKQVLLVEVTSSDPPNLEFNPNDDPFTWDRAIHCLKVIHGELFLLCNIRLRSEFINYNKSAFAEASCIEVPDPSVA